MQKSGELSYTVMKASDFVSYMQSIHCILLLLLHRNLWPSIHILCNGGFLLIDFQGRTWRCIEI